MIKAMKWSFNIVLALVLVSSANATVLFNDTFSDGDRTDGGLPSSGKWILSGSGTLSSVVADNALVSQSSASSFAIVSAFNSQTLAVGETIALSFSVTLDFNGSASTAAFRLGLFNSGGAFPTVDSAGTNGADPAFNGWLGYNFWTPYGAITGDTNFRERVTGDNILFGTSANPSRSSLAYTSSSVVNGTVYQGSFRLTNNGTSLTVAANFGSTVQTWTDTSPSTITFDSLGFFAGGTPIGNGSFTLDDVKVEVIPEPASILFAMTAPLVFLRRKR